MKIGFVLDEGLDKPDGVQQYILTHGTWLRAAGHEVRYLVGQTSRTDIAGLYSIPKNFKVRFNGNAVTIPVFASTKKIKQTLKQEQFDVLHVQAPYSPIFGAKVVKYASAETAVIGTFHILPYGKISSIGTRLLGLWLKTSLRRFDSFVSVSRPAADFAKSTFGINSTVIPNMVSLAEFTPSKPAPRSKKQFRILFLGRLVERKGCRQLLQALKILNDSKQLPAGCVVDICGDGSLRQNLEDYVRQNGLSNVVRFHGFVTHNQKIAYMQAADMAVFPSLSGESFGIVLIEAMAAGSGVVLGGDNPGYRSVLQPVSESIMNVRDHTAFASQLHELIENKDKQAKLHRQQQALVKQFDTPIVGKKLLDLYRTCKSNRIS